MRYLRWVAALMPVLGLSLILSGCGGDKGASTPTSGGTSPPDGGRPKKVVFKGTANLKGRVLFSGNPDTKPEMLKPDKDQDSCPAEVARGGWYVNKDNKGVEYAVVFIKPPDGYDMPKFDELPAEAKELPKDKDGKSIEFVELHQPSCHFEPHVLALHPKQKLKALNDSNKSGKPVAHDTNIQGAETSFSKTLPKPDDKPTEADWTPLASKRPYKVSCGIHANFMGGWIWKMQHPYVVVTDKDGNFEIKNIIVPEGADKMIVSVWHETFKEDKTNPAKDRIQDFGTIELKKDETATKDITIGP